MADNEHRGFSNKQFTIWREKLNKEIKRRGTFTWWDPLVLPTVGSDREPRHILPVSREEADSIGMHSEHQLVSNESYVVKNPSKGAIETTRNQLYPSQGDNPGGQNTDDADNPKTSAARIDQDELRNFLIGLAKMQDIDLFHGRSEKAGVAFRDPSDIGRKIQQATEDILHVPANADTEPADDGEGYTKPDPTMTMEDVKGDFAVVEETDKDGNIIQVYKMPSGQYDGEEILPGHDGPDPTNFYDDYGASVSDVNVSKLAHGTNSSTGPESGEVLVEHDSYKEPSFTPTTTKSATNTPGGVRPKDGFVQDPSSAELENLPGFKFQQGQSGGIDTQEGVNDVEKSHDNPLAFHPQNPFVSAKSTVYQVEQDDYRNETVTEVTEGGLDSKRFGLNPRNPQKGNEYSASSYRTVFSGKRGLCHIACTGLCYMTCDSECNESCTSTCWNRCGNACVSTCANVCTGCETLCYDTCKTKCENAEGYSCVNVGAESVEVIEYGKNNGEWPKNVVRYKTHSCDGCSYSCQFYPNYRTSCTDALCQNMCFYSCYSYCSTACYGGCIDNKSEHDHSTDVNAGSGVKVDPKVEGSDDKVNSPKEKVKDNVNIHRYTTGKGQACKMACTADCVGDCSSTCVGACTTGCFSSCIKLCWSDCTGTCITECGKSCERSCDVGCKTSCIDKTCMSGCSAGCEDNCANYTPPASKSAARITKKISGNEGDDNAI